MDYLADQGVEQESSTLLVAWLDLLNGMASGPQGASTVFSLLSMDSSGQSFPAQHYASQHPQLRCGTQSKQISILHHTVHP